MNIEGVVLRGEEFEPVPGRVVVADGTIEAMEELSPDRVGPDIILPTFVNAHTHLGDSIAKEAGGGLSLDELVAPPDGLKHRLLDAADRAELVEGMAASLRLMATTGTSHCMEFREGGIPGVHALREAASGIDVEPIILGREDPDVIDIADGYGASGARDADFSRERRLTREAGKPFAIHAGERDPMDINDAFDLNPDLLVHMVHAESVHLDRLADNQIPVAVCPRSNLVTGVGTPPIEELAQRTLVALGTDNVMMNGPSMFREMEFTAKLYDLPAAEVLHMATRAGARIADLECGVISAGHPAKVLVLDGRSDNLADYQDPVRAAVRRAGIGDVKRVLT